MSAHDLDENNLPSIKLTADDAVNLSERQLQNIKKAQAPNKTSGAIWALLGAAFIALAGVSWWSYQQISLLSKQLVATQESFAHISEAADGRLQKVSSLVSAQENAVTEENQQLKQQLVQLQEKNHTQNQALQAAEQQIKQLEQNLKQAASDQLKQQQLLEKLQGTMLQAENSGKQITEQLKALSVSQEAQVKVHAELKQNQEKNLASLEQKLKALEGKLASAGNSKALQADIKNLKQDILVLRSELETRTGGGLGVTQQDFDAFRIEVNRRLSSQGR